MPTHFRGSKQSVRALNAYINLVRATDSLLARASAHVEAEGLTLGQFGILESLLHLGPMCQKTLAEKLLRSPGNVTLIVDNLQKQGWVRRERQKDDRRMITIHLTPEGRNLIARIFPPHVKAILKEMGRLESEEQETLRCLCRKLGRGGMESSVETLRKEKKHGASSTK
jgi:MarR family 2-MHQ and catechol resistance regulon transcriptional repressor